MALANVSLQDTFDTWRIRTNQLIAMSEQTFQLAYFASNNTANSINSAIIYSNSIGNVCNSYAMSYANGIGNTVNSYMITYVAQVVGNSSASMAFANTVANNANIATRTYANSAFATIANASLIFGHANAAFNTANNKVSSVSGTSGRISSSGGLTPTLDLATAGAGAASYTGGVSAIGVDAYGRVTSVTASANYQAALGFTPVRQGGGTGQLTNTVYIGWTAGSTLALQIDATNFGATWPINITGSATSAASATLATKASTLSQGGGNGSAMTFSYTLQSGTPPRVWGTTDGVNIVTYSPANFSVSYATSAGSATSATSATTFTSTSQNSQFNSIGVGTAASSTAGEIRATNNITAYYSDKRLKENIKVIDNALDKVSQISGVIFNNNDVAAAFGYTDKSTQVGVIAQEIQEILPMVVRPAPFDTDYKDGVEFSKSGENYLTVQYEKIIPLLIEAIKELKSEVEELKKR